MPLSSLSQRKTFAHTGARTRLSILVVLVVVPILAVQIFGAWLDLQHAIDARKQESVRIIQHAQSDFARVLADARTVFSGLVRLNDLRTPGSCTQLFTNLRFAYERLAPEAANIGLADGQGNIYCAINPIQGNTNIGSQVDFQDALSTLDMAAGIYQLNPTIGTPYIQVSYPVLSFTGEVQTVIFAIFEVNWLENWQNEVALPPGSAVTLLAQDGTVLWRTVGGERVPIRGIHAQEAQWFTAAQAGGIPVEGPDFDQVTRLNSLVSLENTASLHLGYPVGELYARTYDNLRWKLALSGLVVVATLALAWWGSQKMFLHPLNDLLRAVQQVQAGDLGARVSAVTGLGELTDLAQSFDQMADALQQREAERRQIEERFRVAFSSSAIGMGLLTLDGWILAANAAVCEMSGYTEEELKQRNDSQNVYPEDADIGADLFSEMMAGKRGYYSVEKRYVRKNGEIFWTRLTVSLVCDEVGQPSYLIGMIENIDEAKRKSAALTESEARFRILFDTAAVGMGILGLDRKLIAANAALCEIFGWSRGELLGQTSSMVTHPDDLPRAIQYHQDLIAGKFDHYFDERRYIRKNGETFWASISMSLVRDENSNPLYLVGIVNDIDEQKHAVQQLSESEARFRAMFDNAAIGVAVMTLDRRIVQVNQAAVRIVGYSQAELVDIDPTLLTVEEDRPLDRELFIALIEGRRDQYTTEKRYIRKDGSIFWGRVNFSLVRGVNEELLYIIGTIEDITEEKLAAEHLAAQEAEYRCQLELRIAERTEELNLANERLRDKAAQDAVQAERTRLARDLHDAVTQTLFSTTLIADVLPELWEMNPVEGRRRLEELRSLTRGALAEMRTLLVELRPNALVEVPLPTLLRQLVDALSGRARINIQLSAEGERKLPAEVQVGLYRIAQEALNNVVKHANASEAALTLRLGETVRLTVADNGKGFDASTVTADHLGLKIMRERAEAMGARFTIYSDPGEGTQVTVLWQEKLETL